MKTIPNTRPRHLVLNITVGRDSDKATELIAETALLGPFCILAGSDWLPSYALSRLLRRKTVRVKEILGTIQIGRAFTCYQMFDLLESTRPNSEPLLVLDFLHTFYDPDIPFAVRNRVLYQSVKHLKKLSYSRPITLTIQQMQSDDFPRFYSMLAGTADEIIKPEKPPKVEKQLSFFGR